MNGPAAIIGVLLAAGASARQCDPAWVQRAATGPSPRYYAGMVYDSARQRVVLFGGATGAQSSGPIGETWEWDGAAWTRRLVSPEPPARTNPGMVYDSARQRTVLFGGHGTDASVWEWDGNSWLQFSAPGPGATYYPSLAYDSARARTVALINQGTWEWNGSVWDLRATTAPGPIANRLMIYDASLARCVLLPVAYPWWDWDGAQWTVHPYALFPSYWQSFASWVYDPDRSRGIYLTNGSEFYPTLVLDWDGPQASWYLRNASGPGRSGQSAAYDTSRHRLVVFGGTTNLNGNTSAVGDTWEFNPAVNTGPEFTLQPYGYFIHGAGTLVLTSAATGSGTVTYQWYRGETALVNGGNVSGATSPQLTINPATAADSGWYKVVATDACASLTSRQAGVGVGCYANCDRSTTVPYLNVQDFGCYLGAFATGCSTPYDCYPNCDGSTIFPFLNIADFACFLNKFASGCSQP